MNNLTWNDRLIRAVDTGSFNGDDIGRAASFMSCAVGEHQGEYKTGNSFTSAPTDYKLHELGMDFYYAVSANDLPKAIDVYDSIQKWFEDNK